MGKINADWHAAHVMPKNPTEAERAYLARKRGELV